MVTRRDLRAERDFYSPMTGDKSSTYGSQVRSRLEDLKNVKGTRAPAIEAAFVKLLKTEDPFTQIDEKKSYAPDEEDGLMGALEGLGDGSGSDVTERVEEFLEPIVSGGGRSGGNALSPERRQQLSNAAIGRKSTQQLVDRDNRRYGNTVPDGSFGINSKSTDDFSKDPRYQSTAKPDGDPGTPPKTEETRTYYGQGGLPLGTTTIRQGGEVKDGKYVGPQEKGPAINASGFQQANVRGSGNPNNTGKDESQRPKQTVASLPSNYKSTEQKAFAAAKAYKSMTDTNTIKAKQKSAGTNKTVGGQSSQANVGTGKDGGFGTGTYGKGRPSDSKTTTKATPSQKTAIKKSTTVKKSSPTSSGISKSKSRGQGGSKTSSSKKSSGSKSGGSKSSGSKSSGSKSSGSKSNSGSKKSSRGAKGSSSSSSKGGTSRGPSRRTNTRRSRRRCDIRCKFDISVLTNLNLIKDDLADVAYFVRKLKEE